MNKKQILLISLLVLTTLVLTACGGTNTDPAEGNQLSQEEQINQVYTQAAETLAAEQALTEVAQPTNTETPIPSPTSLILPTNTQLPTVESATQLPTLPSLPTPTQIPTKPATTGGRPALRAQLIFEAPKDGHKYSPGESFLKRWNFANSGSTTWNENYTLIHVDGPNFADYESYNLVDVSNMTEEGITNGNKLEITLSMQAPETNGTYRSVWMLRSDNNEWFGIGDLGDEVFWVEIVVRD